MNEPERLREKFGMDRYDWDRWDLLAGHDRNGAKNVRAGWRQLGGDRGDLKRLVTAWGEYRGWFGVEGHNFEMITVTW